MKYLLMTTAIFESIAGIALLTGPALLVLTLFGGALDTPAGLVMARFAGAALLSLGIACWIGSRDAQSRAAIGIVAAMVLYNLAAVGLLMSARYLAGMAGIGLLPGAALHAALAVWCIACLFREGRLKRR